jgi:glycosyltransferase involved in cell wall biosynthesis
MASGLPVVATDIAGIPEQVEDGENGFLIQTGDAAALAEGMKELVGNSALRERMGERGLERAERFSVESMVQELDAVYLEFQSQS